MRSGEKDESVYLIPKNKREELLYKIDPSIGYCDQCKSYYQIENNRPSNLCSKCAPDYTKFAMPLMRRTFPKLMTKELVSVVPIDKPAFVRQSFKKYVNESED